MTNVVEALTGGVAAVAIGEAGSAALDPVFEPVKQDAWKNAVEGGKSSKILEAEQLAMLVAQALNAVGDVIDDVNRNGYDSDEFASLVQLALKAPGPPDAEKLYLRSQGKYPGAISEKLLDHAYAKAGIEYQWWGALTAAAANQLLTPAELALGIVRSTIKDPGILPVQLDTSGSNVKQYPVASLNALDEAAAAGIGLERLTSMVGTIGLPLAPIAAAQAQFRNIITKGAYYQAILEGDVRPEWADAYYDYARQIPTAHDFIEMRLRNYFTTDQQMYDGTARHGMSQDDTDILFRVTGRPLSWHQTWTGTQRGGSLGGPQDDIDPAFLDSLRKSNIRPEYYNLAWFDRNPVPAPFMVRQWLKDGGATDQARKWLTDQGWLTDDIDVIIKEYAATGTSGTSSHVKSAQTSGITRVRSAYTGSSIDKATAQTALTGLDVPVTDQDTILKYWDVIRTIEATIPPGEPGGPPTA